jgi:hypothetical protein
VRRIVAVIGAILLVLVARPAGAQLPDPQVSPSGPQVRESEGHIVLTISKMAPGRVVYRTSDGSCSYQGAPCPPAKAPQDYEAVSGEVIFAQAGSRFISIPIVNDDIWEFSEAFSFEAYDGDDSAGWPTGRFVTIRIHDDDYHDEATTTTTTTAAGKQSSSSAPVVTLPPTPSPVGDLPAPDLAVELASPMLQPGPGFELTGDASAGPAAPAGRGGGDGSASWWAPGLGTAAASVGAVELVRRRRRWSSTRP